MQLVENILGEAQKGGRSRARALVLVAIRLVSTRAQRVGLQEESHREPCLGFATGMSEKNGEVWERLAGRIQPRGSVVTTVVAAPQRRKQLIKTSTRTVKARSAQRSAFLSSVVRSKSGEVTRTNKASLGYISR